MAGTVLAGVVLVGTVLGIALRASALDRQPLWLDEVVTQLRAVGSGWKRLAQDVRLHERTTTRELLDAHFSLRPDRGLSDLVESSREDPHISPFYYLLVRGWLHLAGPSASALRAFSALLGVLLLPVLYVLACELHPDRRLAELLVALAALSPIQVIYAHEARMYTLWALSIALSSLALLRAMHRDRVSDWSLFALATGFAMYCHLFAAIVLGAHALVVLRAARQTVRRFAGASLAGLLMFLPWGIVVLAERQRAWIHTTWLDEQAGPGVRLLQTLRALVLGLIDNGAGYATTLVRSDLLVAAGAVLAIGALVDVARRGPEPLRSLTLGLVATPLVVLALPSLLRQSMTSLISRYYFPLHIAVLIAIACLLLRWLAAPVRRQRAIAWTVLLGTLFASLVSDLHFVTSRSAWSKPGSSATVAIAERLRAEPTALVLAHVEANGVLGVLALAPLVAPTTPVEFVDRAATEPPPPHGGPVFALGDSAPWREAQFARYGCRFAAQPRTGRLLWRLETPECAR